MMLYVILTFWMISAEPCRWLCREKVLQTCTLQNTHTCVEENKHLTHNYKNECCYQKSRGTKQNFSQDAIY